MTLFDLLAVTAFFIPVIAAFDQAKKAHLGFSGFALAVPVGLLVGAGFIVANYAFIAALQTRLKLASPRRQNAFAFVMFLMAIGWIGLSGYCGDRIVSAILRLIFRHG